MPLLRRSVLCAGLGLTFGAACGPPSSVEPVVASELYVALARAREVAIVDTVTDEVRGRISLGSLGARGLPGQIGVDSGGSAAVLPLMPTQTSIGLVPRSAAAPRRPARDTGRPSTSMRAAAILEAHPRCSWLQVGASGGQRKGGKDLAQGLAVDTRGRAYVLVDGGYGQGPTYVAIVELARGTVIRRLALTGPGEGVLALLPSTSGDCLYVATWPWELTGGSGTLLKLDAQTGRVLARGALPDGTAATDLAIGAAPPLGAAPLAPGTAASATPGDGSAVYAIVAQPGPSFDDSDDGGWAPGTRFALTAFAGATLTTLASRPLDERPSALAVTPDGRRAYLLTGAWMKNLVSMALTSTAPPTRWTLSDGCFSLAITPSGKVYVADLWDRLWRVDTRTDTFLGSIPFAGAPVAVAARPG